MIVKIILLIFVSVTAQENDDINFSTSTELCDEENSTCSSSVTTEFGESTTDFFTENDFNSTEKPSNETFNFTIFHTPINKLPKIDYDDEKRNNFDYCLCDLQVGE